MIVVFQINKKGQKELASCRQKLSRQGSVSVREEEEEEEKENEEEEEEEEGEFTGRYNLFNYIEFTLRSACLEFSR